MALPQKVPVIGLFTGDTGPTLDFTINKSDGSGTVDLTGASAKCLIRLMGATANIYSNELGTVDSANAKVTYNLPAAIDDVGVYQGQVEITFASNVQKTSKFQLDVEEGL